VTVTEVHRIIDGRVLCARLGRDVDLEHCLRCAQLAEFELDTTHPYVRCERPLTDPGPAGATF